MDLIITILPVVTKDLPISPRFTPYDFFIAMQVQHSYNSSTNEWLNFYLLTFPRFPLRKKEHKSYFGKNRTRDFRASRCAGYLPDHSVYRVQIGTRCNTALVVAPDNSFIALGGGEETTAAAVRVGECSNATVEQIQKRLLVTTRIATKCSVVRGFVEHGYVFAET